MRSIDLGRRRRGWKEADDVVCAARVHRVLGQYELCIARECKVHAEQTLECLRMDGIASLLLFLLLRHAIRELPAAA